jgi:hypothetical protein
LKWQTVSEINNRGFEIERTTQTVSQGKEWVKIGFIQGKGTTSEIQSYSFLDKNLSAGNYHYRLKQIDYNGTFRIYGPVKAELGIVKEFSLEQNYPNPFNPETLIKYSIPKNGLVTLKIFNVLGKEIKTLVNENKEAGSYEIKFNSEGLSSGVYFYKLESGEFSKIRKMILLR